MFKYIRSTCSSRTSYTDTDDEDDEKNKDNSDERIMKAMNLQEEEQEISAYIKNFPVNLIVMEKCKYIRFLYDKE